MLDKDFDNKVEFEKYCKRNKEQEVKTLDPVTSIPTGFNTMKEINAFASTLPDYKVTDPRYIKVEN